MEYLALGVLYVGVLFSLTGVVGMIRFRDVYTRIHAAGKVATLGVAFIVIAAALFQPQMGLRAVLLALFLLMTAPVSSMVIASAAHRSRDDQPMTYDGVEVRDDLAQHKRLGVEMQTAPGQPVKAPEPRKSP